MFRKLDLWLLQITLVGGLWLHCATAWAQDEVADEGGKSYVLAYVLVGFVVALAMMVVCRGSSRLETPKMVEGDLKHKLEQFQTKKTKKTKKGSSQVVGVKRVAREDLKTVAKYQKGIFVCILIYLIAVICQFAIPAELRPIIGLGVLVVGLVGTVFVFLLATKVYSTGVGVLLGILTLIPCIGLVVLLVVNAKVTGILKQNGVNVGLLGADLSRM